MQAQEKRLFCPGVSLDRLNCPIAEQVRHVAVPLDRHLFLMELVCVVATACGVRTVIKIIGTAAVYSEEVVVAALERAEIRQEAEVPFADQRRAVARLLEH